MLAYQIMSSANPGNAARMARWVDHPDNVMLLTVDALADTNHFRETIAETDRLQIETGIAVTWGGITQVLSMLNAMRVLLAKSSKWRYFINVTDADIPLRHQEQIFETLEREREAGIVDFVNREEPPGQRFFMRFKSSNGLAPVPAFEGLRPDTRFRVHPQLADWFVSQRVSPIWDPWKRIAAHVTDITPEKTLSVRPLYEHELLLRKRFFEEFNPVFGRLWSIISRETCEKLVQWERLPEVLQAFSNTFCPDESFLHTVIWSGKLVPREQVSPNTYRLRNGEAISIHDDMIHEINDPTALFARKILPAGVDRVIARIDEITGVAAPAPPDHARDEPDPDSDEPEPVPMKLAANG